METRFVYVTAPNKVEAERIGRLVVEKRLAACVNILDGMQSLYWWEGAVQSAREAVLVAKTTKEKVAALTAAIVAAHSYDCPCVVSLPIESGHAEFLRWIAAETDRESAFRV